MENQIIFTKLEVEWQIIQNYLEDIGTIGKCYTDKVFYKMFKEMQNYVEKKLKLSGKGDVIDSFLVVLQEQ